MAPRPKRYNHHISGRVGDEHAAVLNGIRDRLETERGKRLQYGDVLRWILEQRAVRNYATPKGK